MKRPAGMTTGMELGAFETATRDLVGLALRSVEDLGVSLPQFRLLLALHELGRPSATECAEALGIVASSVTRLVDRLEAAGHLIRGVDPRNRSTLTLELTESGSAIVKRAIESRRRELRDALDRLPADERATCVAALAKLHEVWGPARNHHDRQPF